MFLNLFLPQHPFWSSLSSPAPPTIGKHLVTCKDKVETSAIHLDHLFGLFPKTDFWPRSGRSVLNRALMVGWISQKKKNKVTTYFLSLSAGFAANMPGLSAIKRDIPQFNPNRPGVAGLSPLNRTNGHPTFYLPPPHLSPFPAPPEINFSTPG